MPIGDTPIHTHSTRLLGHIQYQIVKYSDLHKRCIVL